MADAAFDVRDGMRILWDAIIVMDDGLELRADVFLPLEEGRYPVLLSYGPYAKGLEFKQGYPSAWQRMVEQHPDVAAGSSNKYQSWEVADPEKWVPHGYACVRVDSRGAGCSPGVLDPLSAREARDLYHCVEWCGTQPWSNGKVGITGISYYAMNQWQVGALQPPHLAALCPWEGAADWYRDATHHGGILSTFWANWYDMQVKTVQYGLGERGARSAVTGRPVCGDVTLSDEELEKNRVDFGEQIRSHPLIDDYYRERIPDFSKITVPLFSCGNWGGQGLHLRGNVEGYLRAGSSQKWLEMHGIEHWTHYYTDYGRELQKRFFDYFLRGEDTGWSSQPPVLLNIRHVDGTFVPRAEQEWPIARTRWTKLYLDAASERLVAGEVAGESEREFEALGDPLTFYGDPLEAETEITGPIAVKLFVSSSTDDADLFVVLRLFDPDGEEVVFQGAIDPHTPIAQGWLRVSHRALDPVESREYRPYHPHTELLPVVPGEVYEVDIEVLPTCVVAPAGYRFALSIQGHDYVYPKAGGDRLSNFKNVLTGCGPFLHDDPVDRPAPRYAGRTRLHTGGARQAYVLLPVVPAR
ncbi:MAG TPA: CocE/NonD family hydrolase [Acidimicrobiales bacterium]|nr:CocE/NonD family hydrolase [Acidimicrobiales bacterium]